MSAAAPDQNDAKGKGKATPSRKEQVAANRRPLVVNDRTAARARMREQRERAREGMLRGDERYLPARDKGAQRKFIRDWIDSQWFILGEFALPALIGMVLLSFFLGTEQQTRQVFALVLLYGFLLAVIGWSLVLIAILGVKLRAKYGKDQLERGWRLYAFFRTLNFRSARLPKPQVNRGAKVE